MRTIIMHDDFKEFDLKPSNLLARYIELTEQNVLERLVVSRKNHHPCSCPGCCSFESRPTFVRFGLQYAECPECGTIFVCPRPDEAAISAYYQHSEAEKFWQKELSKVTEKNRRDRIIRPRLDWITDACSEYCPEARHFADIATHQDGFAEEMALLDTFADKSFVNPLIPLLEDSFHGVRVIRAPMAEALPEGLLDAAGLFESLDRAADPEAMLNQVARFLRPGGLCFVTAYLASGFDVLTLGTSARNIFPPDRLNAFTVEGLEQLASRCGFEVLEFSTPGNFDLDIVRKVSEEQPDVELPRFISYLLKNRNTTVRRNFQEFLQSALLSSYGRILLRKRR